MAADSVIASALFSPFYANTRKQLREQVFQVHVPEAAPVEAILPNRRSNDHKGFLNRGGAIAVAHRARNNMARR